MKTSILSLALLSCLASSAIAGTIDEANLAQNESFWPYQVRVTEAIPIPGRKPLGAGTPGVLIRIEPDGKARIDFAQRGIHDVPVGSTNIIERANEHAKGKRRKFGENLVVALGPRMMIWNGVMAEPWDIQAADEKRAFLCVFADPLSEDFAKLVPSLQKLAAKRPRLETFLLPQGEPADDPLIERVTELGWSDPFMMGNLARLYTETLVDEKIEAPTVMLASPAGRVIYLGVFDDEARTALEKILDDDLAPQSEKSAEIHASRSPR